MVHCPTCRKPLVVLEFQGVEVDFCPTCHGCWLDRGELGLLLQGDPSRDPGLALAPGPRGTRPCPRCGDRMHEAALTEAQVVVDQCPHGHGLWLDRGELQSIANAVADSTVVDQLADFCDRVFGAAST